MSSFTSTPKTNFGAYESQKAPLTIALVCAALLLLVVVKVYQSWSRLSTFPGPFLASLTNLSRVFWVNTRRAHEIHQDLHRRHGDFVRFGPNVISISNPAAIPTVYPLRTGFPKGNFYRVLMPYTKGGALPAVFNTRDENLHKQLRTPIAPIFSMGNVMHLEQFVDQVLEVVFHQFDTRFVGTGESFDFGAWMQYYAFDVMGTLTFSKRYGFLEKGEDVNNMLATIWSFMQTVAPFTQIPWLDEWWNKNPWLDAFRKPFGLGILTIVADCCNARIEASEAAEKGSQEQSKDLNERDMLSRFIEIQSCNPSIPPWAVKAWSFSNVIAGSDSTASVLKTTWYGLLANRHTLEKLRKELLDANLTRPIPTFAEVRDLPYLDACINEGSRMHPPFCLPFERVVPAEGISILGKHIPPNTIVGMSPYVVNRHQPTFGEDAETWNPDRFMVPEDLRRVRENAILTFGAGRRVCLGKHVAILEMKKVIPALLLNYEIAIVDAKRYGVENSWFFRQFGLDTVIRRV